MSDDAIRKLLSELPTAPFIWSAPGTVIIMEEKAVEAGADPEAVAAWVEAHGGDLDRTLPVVATRRGRDRDPQAEGQALLRRAGEGTAALRRRLKNRTAVSPWHRFCTSPSRGRCAVHIRVKLAVAVAVTGAMAVAGTAAIADHGSKQFRASLDGYQEVPAVSTTGNGAFRATVTQTGDGFAYRLSYAALEGNVQQAHIHLGQRAVNGGISVFLCSNLGNGPAGTPACPPPPATVTGTIDAADVVGPTNQGIAPGELAELLRAMRAGVTYANVHTMKFPGGEIRGQIRSGGGDRDDDEDDEDDED